MKKAGSMLGFAFLIIGLGGSFIGYSMYSDAGFSFKFLLFMPIIASLGLGLLFFPGPDITLSAIKAQEATWKDVLVGGSLKDKVMWGLFSALGFVVYAMRDEVATLF